MEEKQNAPHSPHESHENAVAPHPSHRADIKKKDDNLSIPIAIVFAGILIAGAIIFTNNSAPVSSAPLAVDPASQGVAPVPKDVDVDLLALRADDHIQGNPNADVVIIEYSDTECPFCKRFHDTMVEVMKKYGNSGQVAWVYRYFPLDMHPRAKKEAEGLECAFELGGNDAFWKYADKIFEITPANNGLDVAMIPKIAGMVGLDVPKFTQCLDSGKYTARVQRDFVNGANVGVRGTPYSIIWNRKTGKQIPVNGAYPIENLTQMIDQAIGS
ncbi:MAG: Periplasmic thiol:disulfide interchange protein DsbA [Parcubacteria group bacterium GW2011_GWA2_47_7]|nr:MAG: Periplasmic thiol:disulfide interchange protein DsbA [Parcubacteria group bacterium GW2011_GWA2_47_7]